MIIADYDGTTAVGENVNEEVVNAINAYRNVGGKFVFCTGRHRLSIEKIMRKNNILADGIISLQGSFATVGAEIAVRGGIPVDDAKKIIADVHSLNKKAGVFGNDVIYYENDLPSYKYASYFADLMPTTLINDLTTFNPSDCVNYGKIIVNDVPNDEIDKITDFINEKYGEIVVCNSGASGLVEIVSVNYTKYQTAKRVAERLGVGESEVVTIGDSTNDLTLINYGYGIAVGSGDERLKKAAKAIAPPINENPLRYVIDKVLKEENFI